MVLSHCRPESAPLAPREVQLPLVRPEAGRRANRMRSRLVIAYSSA